MRTWDRASLSLGSSDLYGGLQNSEPGEAGPVGGTGHGRAEGRGHFPALPQLLPQDSRCASVRWGEGPSMQTPRGVASLCPAQEISGQPQHKSGFWPQASAG